MYAFESFVMDTPDACVLDLTPPVFLGLGTLVPQANGSLFATWLAASDSNSPIEYLIYVQKLTASGLFLLPPAYIRTALDVLIFQDSLGALLQAGEIYFVGVRAKDALGNLETNLVTLNVLSAGVLTNTLAQIANQISNAAEQITGGPEVEIESDEIEVGVDPLEDEVTGTFDCE